MTGRFISLEGGEGVGKSTQMAALADALRARGLSVITTREPGGTPNAEALRALLMTGAIDRWSAGPEAMLFAAARGDHVARVIRPALERGDWVICDRFVDSSRAYQGGGGGLTDDDIMTLHRIGSGGLMPDRTLLLTMAPGTSEQRLERRDGGSRDRMDAKAARFREALDAAFEQIAAQDPLRVIRIDAHGSAEAVTARLLGAIKDLLP